MRIYIPKACGTAFTARNSAGKLRLRLHGERLLPQLPEQLQAEAAPGTPCRTGPAS